MGIQERLTAFAMLGAEWVMWVLVGLSVVGLAIVLERAYAFFATRDDVLTLKDRFLDKLRAGDREGASALLEQSRSVEAQVVAAGLEASADGTEAVEHRLAGASQMAKLHMERNLTFLGTVGNNAPFVGLLGTVIGVIRSFAALEQSEGQVSDALMSEIGEALVATAIGILVAIPAVAFFNLFQRMIKSRLAQADDFGRALLAWCSANGGNTSSRDTSDAGAP